jgi:transcriptional regulator with XRE-family HTH domain
MTGSFWDPLPEDLTTPEWDLVVQLRYLLDAAGVSLEQLAQDRYVQADPETVWRVLTGRAFPTRELLELIARTCDGDLRELYDLHERARRAAMGRRAPATGRRAAVPTRRTRAPARRVRSPATGRRAPAVGGRAVPPGGVRGPGRAFDRTVPPPAYEVEPDYDTEFWTPMPGEPEDLRLGHTLRKQLSDAGERLRRQQAAKIAMERQGGRSPGPRARPTIVAAILLASFAVGIVLATLVLGGPSAEEVSRLKPENSAVPGAPRR